MIEVRAAPPEHYSWIADRAALIVSPAFRALEALDAEGNILGMVGYDGWTPNSCCMHVALESQIATRRLLTRAFTVPFRLGRNVLLASVLSTNTKSLKFVKHLGFKVKARIQDGWSKGVDLVLFEMRRENCRWVKE